MLPMPRMVWYRYGIVPYRNTHRNPTVTYRMVPFREAAHLWTFSRNSVCPSNKSNRLQRKFSDATLFANPSDWNRH
jgi:hypothetical protein